MIVADFHVHSTFSVDGMSTMEQHCIAAIQKGIKKICFTEHVDYNIAAGQRKLTAADIYRTCFFHLNNGSIGS